MCDSSDLKTSGKTGLLVKVLKGVDRPCRPAENIETVKCNFEK